jgi:3-phenylpropionate/trans-cinnamate dioxygenase ferredoxin reductase component
MSKHTFVIVGASLAGAKAAAALRRRGFDGGIVLVGAEAKLPDERPPLSKDYLRGESDREEAYVQDADFCAEQQIELLSAHAAMDLDVGARRVVLNDGRRRFGNASNAAASSRRWAGE